MLPASMIGRGRNTGTFSFIVGGTGTITVTLSRSFPDDFLPFASISKQTIATLGLGTVSIKEAKRNATDNQVDVVVVSNSILSSVTVEVVAMGLAY